jgi:hypothetical protein
MQAESLEILEKADVAPAQARAIVRAIEIELSGARDTLATKHDLMLLRQEFHSAIENLRRAMIELASALRSEMAELRAELTSEIASAISGVVRQVYLAILGQMAVLLGFSYFFATHVR